MDSYDLVVIGGGAAGEKGAAQAAFFGKKVALVEKEPIHGGAMVNTGTLPSKTLRETALYFSGFRQRGLHGVDFALSRQATVRDLLFRLENVVAEERLRLVHNMQRHGVACLYGAARFVDAHTIEVEGPGSHKRLHADKVLIATGSTPFRPPLFAFEHERIYDSDEIVSVHHLPRKMVVVGAGVIGCEYACIFAAIGAKVTLVESRPAPLGFLDTELVERLVEKMEALGVSFRMPDQVASCDASDAGVTVRMESGLTLEADAVLVCAGRQANTEHLNLEAAGLKAGKRGQLTVDATYRTQVPHIAAVGDVIGFPALASTSMEQARVAVVHMFDLKYKTALAPVVPYGIYTIPEVSSVGESEESLREKGIPYVKGLAEFSNNARGIIIGDEGFLKLLFRKDDMRLLGVHCLGEGATELIHVGVTALMSEMTADLFIQTCFNYPTLSEAYKYAAYDALGRRARA